MLKIKSILACILVSMATSNAFAIDHTYTNEDEWAAYEGFHSYLIDSGRNIYKADTQQPNADHRGNGARDNDFSGCAAAIWCQAIYFDMCVNAYKRCLLDPNTPSTRLTTMKKRLASLYRGEKNHYVSFDFNNSNTNNGWFVYDDIMWWTCSLARAYEVSILAGTPDENYLNYSEKSFCRVWYGSQKVGDDGSYADPADGFTGGMFWEWQPIDHAKPHTDNGFKSACINFPTVIACCTLYSLVPEDRVAPTVEYPTYQTKEFYFEKAKEIYDWAKAHFCSNTYPGRVADGIHGGGPEWSDHLYNQATYIGASCMLYKLTGDETYLNNAREGADYVKNRMCSLYRGTPILPEEKGYEQGVYTAIFAQYIKMLIDDCGQTEYLPWIQDNIEYGWTKRDTTRNLQDANFKSVCTEGSTVESYGASALPALMIQFPVDETSGIVTAKTQKKSADDNIYAIDGKKVSSMACKSNLKKGIYIIDNKKVSVK